MSTPPNLDAEVARLKRHNELLDGTLRQERERRKQVQAACDDLQKKLSDARAALRLREQWLKHPEVEGALVMASMRGGSPSSEVLALARAASEASERALRGASAPEATAPKITRNESTPEARKFWRDCDEAAREVQTWPDWKRAGVNAAHWQALASAAADL